MTIHTASRAAILARLQSAPSAAVPERIDLPPAAPASPSELLDRFGQAAARIQAVYRRCATPDVARQAVAAVVAERGIRTAARWDHPLLAELGLDEVLAAAGVQVHSPADVAGCPALAAVDLGLTAAEAGVAESGSLVVAAAPDMPRAFSLLPPVHLALVRAGQVVAGMADIPAVLAGLTRADGRLPSAVHVISGPSCTADIELIKVYGVHGPTTLVILGLDW